MQTAAVEFGTKLTESQVSGFIRFRLSMIRKSLNVLCIWQLHCRQGSRASCVVTKPRSNSDRCGWLRGLLLCFDAEAQLPIPCGRMPLSMEGDVSVSFSIYSLSLHPLKLVL